MGTERVDVQVMNKRQPEVRIYLDFGGRSGCAVAGTVARKSQMHTRVFGRLQCLSEAAAM
jgi:hypothetical protein